MLAAVSRKISDGDRGNSRDINMVGVVDEAHGTRVYANFDNKLFPTIWSFALCLRSVFFFFDYFIFLLSSNSAILLVLTQVSG